MHYSKVIKICIILAVLLFGSWKCFVFLEQNGCLDEGNVWDYNENRCREEVQHENNQRLFYQIHGADCADYCLGVAFCP